MRFAHWSGTTRILKSCRYFDPKTILDLILYSQTVDKSWILPDEELSEVIGQNPFKLDQAVGLLKQKKHLKD